MTNIDWPNFERHRRLNVAAVLALCAFVAWGLLGLPGLLH